MEQTSNALVVGMLNLGKVMHNLDRDSVSRFLESAKIPPVEYPDVAFMIASCIDSGDWVNIDNAVNIAWEKTGVDFNNSLKVARK